ncbi:uncharacterized protein RMCC_4937 [Mycolicibacterium canariasense]|uniref:Transmembrane protein n=1 Tax=Mycolicibacterium canariasense TaxID=228230 RepID=A0A100WG88_MYCCR|nr:DUF5336 domain-containing protein [Mycolicibacterium canariasense]MCV7212454.1 hypothetical protein [Mycolicibacterium canariasense]GAS97972.1 uncharacterized protein RMCC_4937 [Mycolicibacterium canariasense]
MNQEADAFEEDGYDIAAGSVPRTKSTIRQVLWTSAGALGLAAWVVGLTAMVSPGLAVPLAVLAGAVAAVGLLPGQAVRGWLVVAVAFTAFTAATTATVTAAGAGWALIAVDVLVALQVVVAVSALLLEPRVAPATQSAPGNDYAAYAEYVRAYRDYVQQYESQWPEQYSAAERAAAAGGAHGAVAGTAHDEPGGWADLQATYARHLSPVAPAPSERSARRADGGDTADAGLPGVDWVTPRPPHAGSQNSPGAAPMSPGAY